MIPWVASTRSFSRALSRIERITTWPPHHLSVLTYHRVDELGARPDRAPSLLSATPAEVDRQMRDLTEHTNLVTVDELLAARRGDHQLPPRAVLVTFDDAVDDFARHAWPALRRHGIPVVLFVPTGFPSTEHQPFWWDRLHHALSRTTATVIESPLGPLPVGTPDERGSAYRRLRDAVKARPHREAMALVDDVAKVVGDADDATSVLSWPELRALAAEGVVLAPHSRSHAMLDQVSDEVLVDELEGSRRDLEQEIGADGCALSVFAYPSGRHDARVVAAAAAAGYEVAFTTERGHNRLGDADWLRLRRVNVGGRSPLPVLRAQLHPWAGRLLERTGGSR